MFTLGICIIMNGYTYQIDALLTKGYLLNQKMVSHEQVIEMRQAWKASWIDMHAKKIDCKKWRPK